MADDLAPTSTENRPNETAGAFGASAPIIAVVVVDKPLGNTRAPQRDLGIEQDVRATQGLPAIEV